ncbi:MAG: hypothetical protein AAGA67_13725 [Cyanobacteria bacterium P01_F01_bin.153]
MVGALLAWQYFLKFLLAVFFAPWRYHGECSLAPSSRRSLTKHCLVALTPNSG